MRWRCASWPSGSPSWAFINYAAGRVLPPVTMAWRNGARAYKGDRQRDSNLKISGLGIRDFGDGRGYSALDLVMAARGTDLFESFCWLDEKLRPTSKEWEEGL